MSNSLQLQCVARGLGSVDEMGQTVLRDDTVQFCLVRLPLGSGTFARVKLVHIMNIGPRCSAVQRGRLTSQLSSVLKRFGATSAGMEIHSAQEASFDYMLNKLGKVLVADYTEAGTSPSALREQYLQNIRAAAEAAAQQEAWLERKASREELSRLRNGPLAGSSSGKFTPHEVPNPVDSVNSPATHESQHEDVPQTVDVMRSTAATVELISASASPTATARRPLPPMPGVDPSTPLGQKGLTPNFLLKSLRDDCGEYNWCMHFVKTDEAFSMQDDMVDGGRGGLEELCNILRDPDICDDKIAVGLLRMSFGSGRFRRVKFVFYHYMGGDNVSSMARAKVNAKIPEIMKQLKPFTLEIRIQNSDEAVPRFFFHSLQDKLVSDNIVSDTDTSLFRKNRNKKTTPAAKSEDTVPEAPDPEVSSSIEAEASNQPTTTKEPQRGEANTMAELLELEYRRALEEEQAMHAERRQAVCAEEEQQAEEERDTVSEELKTPDEESNPETTSTAVEAPPQTERGPSRDPPQETPSLQVFDADSTIALLRSESMNAPYTWAVFEFLKK